MSLTKIKNIGVVGTGTTPSMKNKEYYSSNDIPFIKPGDILENVLTDIDEGSTFISESARGKARIFPKGSILCTCIGIIGKIGVVQRESSCNQQINYIIPDDSHDSRFIAYSLLSKKDELSSLGSNAPVVPIVNKGQFQEFEITTYSIDKEIRIRKELDYILLALKNKIEELKELDNLVKSRFIEMFGKVENKKRIGDIASICRGASPRPISKFVTDSPDGVNWIKIGDVGENDVYITKTAERITKEGARKSRSVKNGDFILSNSMSFGRPYILRTSGCVHDGWLIISDYEDVMDQLFFYYELRSDLVQSQFDGSANGATVRNLNSDRVKNTEIVVPTLEKQKEFTKFALEIDKSKFIVQKQIEDLQELLDSKMDEYFG